ncbi:MAG: hypothetical protein A2W77_07965 [Nitrospinae bacterium RIFCSPLOWO2_12_39_16]|nr:MAG: hypothetical protein A2W77_07965 [Nitrospinae bacterium RIFCSPLOWO2_12_39_16]
MGDFVLQIKELLESVEALIADPNKGLPEDIFLFVSRITPLINVDLLIKDDKNGTLLTWRDDGYCAAGWHIPGGIIRYKETMAARIEAVAKNELGTSVEFDPTPIAINEIIHPSRNNRGHFISLLIRCSLTTPPEEDLRFKGRNPMPDEWMWHKCCPDNIIPVHEIYRKFI